MSGVAETSFVGGEYTDARGRVWTCHQRYLDQGSDAITCISNDMQTAANPETFKLWGWVAKEQSA